MFIAALSTMTKNYKPLKCPSTEEQIYYMWYKHTMEYYMAIKRNEVLIHVTT
jgi:hypothetical protein